MDYATQDTIADHELPNDSQTVYQPIKAPKSRLQRLSILANIARHTAGRDAARARVVDMMLNWGLGITTRRDYLRTLRL